MDLASGDTIGVDVETGDVLIHHDGLTGFVKPADCQGFEVHEEGAQLWVSLSYADGQKQLLGYTDDFQATMAWVLPANQVITKYRRLAAPKARKPAPKWQEVEHAETELPVFKQVSVHGHY